MHYALPQLIALDERYPTERKLLLVPSINFGRELLASLAHERGSWIGWEVSTLATIAQKLAVVELARMGRRRGSDVAIAELVSTAFDAAIRARQVSETLASLSWSAGTRTAIVDALLELRMAGVDSTSLRAVGQTGVASSLAAVMEHFDGLRGTRALADVADVFAAAISAFSEQAPFVLDHSLLVCTPGWTVRGLPRRLLKLMSSHGMRVLAPIRSREAIEPPHLVDSIGDPLDEVREVRHVTPSATMFSASGIADEARQVLRQILTSGCRLDEVEIVCTDSDAYGIEFESLCEHLSASLTSLDGIPLTSTRIGRATERWFNWIESDHTAEHIRGAIESGDWQLERDDSGIALASELRRLKIGWGFDQILRARQRLSSPSPIEFMKPFEDEADEDFEQRKQLRLIAMERLGALLDVLTASAPASGSARGDQYSISVPELAARSSQVFSALIKPGGAAENSTMQRLMERLSAIASISREPVAVPNALATIRQELSDLRAWTDTSNTPRPRRATGGHIHLTNVESAGATGRPLQFFVGLDADRSAGPVVQSPLLPDSLRNRLNERGAELATTEHRRREGAWKIANAIRSSDAAVTLSYSVRGGSEGRDSGPSAAMLQAAREIHGTPTLNYEELRHLLGAPVSAVPAPNDFAIDERDVWLGNMADGALLLDAESAARRHFAGLDRGLNAEFERDAEEAGAYHGLVPDAGRLDPRATKRPISPSSLEMIASCSLRWFYAAALNARAPEEPAYDALVWLNPMERGSALHSIYERLVKERLYESPMNDETRRRIAKIVSDVAAGVERSVPVPSAAIKTRELSAMLDDAILFVTSEHEAFVREPWETVALESNFGVDTPAVVPLGDGTELLVHGRVDRVDRMQDGTLRLVDYKSGRAFVLDSKRGAFDGGRKLQLAVYSPAISKQFDAVVSAAEYRFPTERGDGEVARANATLLSAAPEIVRSLLDDVAAGRFVPTIDKDDCAFCDYNVICRTVRDRFATESPRAAWARQHADTSAHFVGVLTRKKSGGSQ